MFTHTRSIADKVFEVWRSPGRFTKNPDVIALSDGRLLLVYSDTDAHWAQESEILTILCSDDQGRTWRKVSEVAVADQRLGDERLVTPRLSYLSDGRLVVLCDHDDYSNFHEDQPSGNWLWWSSDGGQSWSSPHVTGILGIEPDRVMELPDGALGVGSHLLMGESQEFAEILTVSTDGGVTWNRRATIAHNGYHRFCEGAIVLLDSGEMACILRENHSGGIPSFVTFSTDNGHTWTAPAMLPFAIHRPYARQLADGRVLVTGRNVNGGLGCYAWCGDLRAEAGSWQIGGPRRNYTAHLTDEALTIENRPAHECRYTLLPPESSRSEIHFEAEIRVDGPAGQSVAFLSVHPLPALGGPCVIEIAADSVGFGSTRPDRRKPVDMTQWHTVGIHHCRGLLQITVDGDPILHGCVFRESPHPGDFHGGDPARRTQFGQMGDVGSSHWRRIDYTVNNPTLPPVSWRWEAQDRRWPDQYQRDRMLQIHGNHPDQKPWPDHGYSSWLPLPDGRIFLVDYSNHGDLPSQSHLVGVYIDPEDLT